MKRLVAIALVVLAVVAAWPWPYCGVCRRRVWGLSFADHVHQHTREYVEAYLPGLS